MTDSQQLYIAVVGVPLLFGILNTALLLLVLMDLRDIRKELTKIGQRVGVGRLEK